MIGPAMVVVLVLFSITLFTPLLTTKALFLSNEIGLMRIAHRLFSVDLFLFCIVVGFGIVIPVCKMLMALWCWYSMTPDAAVRFSAVLSVLGKLSMADVMLLAVFIVGFKGLGIGQVQVHYGVILYTVVVLGSHVLSLLMTNTVQRLRT